jgi:hypothetical protein
VLTLLTFCPPGPPEREKVTRPVPFDRFRQVCSCWHDLSALPHACCRVRRAPEEWRRDSERVLLRTPLLPFPIHPGSAFEHLFER